MMFEAVLFDADETIFNNQGIHQIITERILEDLHLPKHLAKEVHARWDFHYFSEQAKKFDARGFCIDQVNNTEALIKALKEFGCEIDYQQAEAFWSYTVEEFSKRSTPYPDALETIDALQQKGVKMAIVSNGDKEIINLRLEKAGIKDAFAFVLAPEHAFPLSKPKPAIFQHSLKLLEINNAKKTMFIGDNPTSDIRGANQAGMFSVLIDRANAFTNLEGLLKPKMKVRSLTTILELF
ncbi:MAG: HAD family hydrolase [Candidatus Heimdallarchaeota archaeon]